MLTGRQLIKGPTIIVITVPALDGFVLKDPPAQECQLHVHLSIGVTLMQPAG